MDIIINTKIFKSAFALATPPTKNLGESGFNGDTKNFPKQFRNYKWSNTRDFNLVLIIIALYVYCLKSKEQALQKIGMKARMTSKNSPFEALERGDGATVAKNLTEHFGDKKIQKLILNLKDKKPDPNDEFDISKNINEYNNITCEQVFDNGLFKRAKKITKWKINQSEVVRYIHLLTDPIQKQHTANLKKEKEELKNMATKEINLMAKKAKNVLQKSNKKSKIIIKLKGE